MAQWVKGQSGNPAGRPKGATGYKHTVEHTFIEKLRTPVVHRKKETIYLEAFMDELLLKALSGRSGNKAQMFLADRLIQPGVFDSIDAWLKRGKEEEQDYIQFRIRKSAFDKQQEVLDTHEKFIMLMCGRRAGKTVVSTKKIVSTLLAPALRIKLNGIEIEKPTRVCYIGLTITKAIDLIYDPLLEELNRLGIEIESQRRNEGYVKLASGAEFYCAGNNNKAEREKARGPYWSLIVIDECQSQNELKELLEAILEPELKDVDGVLMMMGTGPKVRGTHWEFLWENKDNRHPGLRKNWNLTDNPTIPDHEKILKDILKKKGWTESNSTFQREYLGKIAYDDDALVYRLTDKNFYTDEELDKWIKSQPPSDLRFTAGQDYGYRDADAFVIILYSISKPEKWLIFEHKKRRQGIDETAAAIRKGMDYITSDNMFLYRIGEMNAEYAQAGFDEPDEDKPVYIDKRVHLYTDTNEPKVSLELVNKYLKDIAGLIVHRAYKNNKGTAIETLQDDIRQGLFKCRKGGSWEDECLHIIFGRDEEDILTREIDDAEYHPDELDAILYSLRSVWGHES